MSPLKVYVCFRFSYILTVFVRQVIKLLVRFNCCNKSRNFDTEILPSKFSLSKHRRKPQFKSLVRFNQSKRTINRHKPPYKSSSVNFDLKFHLQRNFDIEISPSKFSLTNTDVNLNLNHQCDLTRLGTLFFIQVNETYQKIDFIKQKYSKQSKFEISRKI